MTSVSEIRFTVRGLQLAAKRWHEGAPIKVLALHGWLDNAASFDAIAPYLTQCDIVALDLAGQGLSDFRSLDATYHLCDDLLDIIQVLRQLDWQHVNLLGHSRGAMLSTLLSASLPELVIKQVLVDGLLPIPAEPQKSPEQLTTFLQAFSEESRPNFHESEDKLIALRMKKSGMSLAATRLLASRAIHHDKLGYYWRVDQRLKFASAVKLSEVQIIAFVNALKCPTRLLLAKDGLGQLSLFTILAKRQPKIIDCQTLSGGHHMHMDEQVEGVTERCKAFFSS